jgi:Ca2+-binding RTX toxin-like protein
VLFDTSMRVLFLVSGLAFFAVTVVVAAVPVLAQGGTTPACTIRGGSGGDLLIGTAGADVICGYGGSDTITAKGGNDIVRGGYGADTIYGDAGSDHLHGGPGNDKIYARDAIKDYIYGGKGFDYARDDDPEDVLHSIESH